MTARTRTQAAEVARRVVERAALPGADDEERRAREEHLRAVLAGQETMPVPRYVQVRRADGEPAPNGEEFHVSIRASTDGLARDGGIVPLEAWQEGGLENFEKNPVVMLSHGFGFPLGLSVHNELDADEGALVAWWRFHEETEESRVTRRLYEGGWMRAASVGFRVLAWHEPDEDEAEQLRDELNLAEGQTIWWVADRAELLEQSAVSVPSDPDALTTASMESALANARAHGVDTGPLEQRLRALGGVPVVGRGGAGMRGQRDEQPTDDEGDDREDGVGETDGELTDESGSGELELDLEDDSTTAEPVEEEQVDEPADADEGGDADESGEEATVEEPAEAPAAEADADEGGDAAAEEPAAEDEDEDGRQGDDGQDREGERAAIRFQAAHEAGSYEVADRDAEWDGAAEVADMEGSEESLLPRHAMRVDDGDADAKSTYKFPHHRAGEGMEVVFRALAAGFARLDQADASDEEKDGVAAHLGRHYEEDYDAEPPERDAVAAAVREWPEARGEDETDDEHGDRVQVYLEDHGETLRTLGGGDVELAAAVVAEAAAEMDAGGRQEGAAEEADAEDAPETGGRDDDVEGEDEADADEAAAAGDDELREQVQQMGERVADLEEAVGALREFAEEARALLEELRDEDQESEGASEDETTDDGRSAGLVGMAVRETDDGERVAVVEVGGREVEVPMREGETGEQFAARVADQVARKRADAPVRKTPR